MQYHPSKSLSLPPKKYPCLHPPHSPSTPPQSTPPFLSSHPINSGRKIPSSLPQSTQPFLSSPPPTPEERSHPLRPKDLTLSSRHTPSTAGKISHPLYLPLPNDNSPASYSTSTLPHKELIWSATRHSNSSQTSPPSSPLQNELKQRRNHPPLLPSTNPPFP